MDFAALRRARMLVGLDRDAEARAMLSGLLADDPEEPEALCLLAQACLGVEDFPAALQAAAAAGRSAPESEWPCRLQSIALARLGRGAEAQVQADQAIRLAPDEWRTHVSRAQVDLIGDARSPASLAAARQAVRLAPHEAETHRVLGAVLLASEHADEAEAPLLEALRLDPQNYAARNDLARLHLRRNQLGNAARGFADAAALAPTDAAAAGNLLVVGGQALRRVHLIMSIVLFTAGREAISAHGPHRGILALGWAVAVVALGFFGVRLHAGAGSRTLTLARIVLRRDRLLAAWAGCLGLAFASLSAAVVLPTALILPAVGASAAALLVGAILSWTRSARDKHRAKRTRV